MCLNRRGLGQILKSFSIHFLSVDKFTKNGSDFEFYADLNYTFPFFFNEILNVERCLWSSSAHFSTGALLFIYEIYLIDIKKTVSHNLMEIFG